MSMNPSAVCALALCLSACSTIPSDRDATPEVEQLFAADRAFCADAAADRLDGWMRWFDPNAAKVPIEGEVAQGTASIRELCTSIFADLLAELRWEPEVGGIVEPGRLGFTRGRYSYVKRSAAEDGSETVLSTGTYLTVWHWTPAGWRVALDTGVRDED